MQWLLDREMSHLTLPGFFSQTSIFFAVPISPIMPWKLSPRAASSVYEWLVVEDRCR